MEPTEQAMTRRTYISRWLGVVPGAALSVIVTQFPIHWLVMFQYQGSPDYDFGGLDTFINPQTLELFMNAFFSPFIFIAVGVRIAPEFKFYTGIGLSICLGIFYGIASTVVFGEIQEGLYTPVRWLRLGITVLLCIAGIATGLYQASKVDKPV